MGGGEDEPEGTGPEASEPEASVRHRPRRPARHFSSPAIGGGDPRDGEWPWLDDDASDAGEPERSFLGVVGQLAAALLAVAAIVALLIAAAIAFGWILP